MLVLVKSEMERPMSKRSSADMPKDFRCKTKGRRRQRWRRPKRPARRRRYRVTFTLISRSLTHSTHSHSQMWFGTRKGRTQQRPGRGRTDTTCAWKPNDDMNLGATFGDNFERAEDEGSTSSPFEGTMPSHHPHYTIRDKWNLWTKWLQLILTTGVTFQYVRASWLLPRSRSDVAVAAVIDNPPASSTSAATAATTAQSRRRSTFMPIWTALAKCAADRRS